MRTPPRRPRRSQAERSAATRRKLLDATLESLIERGYAGTTTLAVCRRAGVSHGSLLHHYGTRERLLGEALREVYERLRSRTVARLASLPQGAERAAALVDRLWEAFGAREFKAVLELWLAAANDPEVSWSVWPEARSFDASNEALGAELFPDVAERVPEFPVYVSLIFQALQGMALAQSTLGHSEQGDAMRERVRALLARIVAEAFADGRGRTA